MSQIAKFEYKLVKTADWRPESVEQVLNELGEQGWEAVGMGWMTAGPNGGGDTAILLKRARS